MTNERDEAVDLGALDPGHEDSGYWSRFHSAVMARATWELARRREQVRLTVPGVLSSWSRRLIPAALVAAGIAALVVMNEARTVAEDMSAPVALEEALSDGSDDGPFQAVLAGTVAPDRATFLALIEEDLP